MLTSADLRRHPARPESKAVPESGHETIDHVDAGKEPAERPSDPLSIQVVTRVDLPVGTDRDLVRFAPVPVLVRQETSKRSVLRSGNGAISSGVAGPTPRPPTTGRKT